MEPLPQLGSRSEKKKTKSFRAGLLMPVTRIHTSLRKGKFANRISIAGSVYMTAVLEYLCVEVFEGAKIEADNANKHRITPRHITLSIRQDDELNQLLNSVIISQGGISPFIHNKLLPKKSKTSK